MSERPVAIVTGGSAGIGATICRRLIDAGHEVIGTHNSPAGAQLLQELAASPVALDVLDEDSHLRSFRYGNLGS